MALENNNVVADKKPILEVNTAVKQGGITIVDAIENLEAEFQNEIVQKNIKNN